jgi:putative ABC transport system substrate-binding protein
VTGVSFRTEGLTGKQVELALQMIPDVAKIGYLVNVASGIIRRPPQAAGPPHGDLLA